MRGRYRGARMSLLLGLGLGVSHGMLLLVRQTFFFSEMPTSKPEVCKDPFAMEMWFCFPMRWRQSARQQSVQIRASNTIEIQTRRRSPTAGARRLLMRRQNTISRACRPLHTPFEYQATIETMVPSHDQYCNLLYFKFDVEVPLLFLGLGHDRCM